MNDIHNIPFHSAAQGQELQSDNHRKSERRKTLHIISKNTKARFSLI